MNNSINSYHNCKGFQLKNDKQIFKNNYKDNKKVIYIKYKERQIILEYEEAATRGSNRSSG